MAKDVDMMTDEEKANVAAAALAKVFPLYEVENFSTSYADGAARIHITLKWFQIDPSEGET